MMKLSVRANLHIPGIGLWKLTDVSLSEPNEALSVITGYDEMLDAEVTFEILELGKTLVPVKVTVNGTAVYTGPSH